MRHDYYPKQTVKVRSNTQIRVPEIRLIDENGKQVGVVPIKEGLQRAEEAGLDLVEISASVKPPVCRILELGKYLYSLSKKEKESRKKQKVIDVKEIKMTSKIGEHDYQTKLRNAHRFLERGDKVKLSLFFRGREITYVDIGKRIVQRFVDDLADVAVVERNAGLEGRSILLYLAPNASNKKSATAAAPEKTNQTQKDSNA